MRHRAEYRDVVQGIREHRRRPGEPGDIACPCCHQSGFGAVCPAKPEVDEQLARRRQHTSRCLGCNHCLEMNEVDQACLDQLRLRQRRDHLYHGFVGEKGRAFGHCTYLAGEAQFRKIVEQRRLESSS